MGKISCGQINILKTWVLLLKGLIINKENNLIHRKCRINSEPGKNTTHDPPSSRLDALTTKLHNAVEMVLLGRTGK